MSMAADWDRLTSTIDSKYKWDTEREGDKRKRIETVEERKSRRKQNKSKGKEKRR